MEYRVLVWLAFVLHEWCITVQAQWCPGECSCFNAFTTVDCSQADLTFIPMMPNSTTHLYLENNRLHRLDIFAFHDIPKAVVLNFHANLLTAVDASAFAGLHRLQDLNLSHNRLKLFTVSFTLNVTLKELKDLDLSGNRLWTIPRNLSYFAPELEVLNLSYNQIASGWFDDSYRLMTSLHEVDLTGNPIHTLASFHLKPLHHLPLESLKFVDCALVHLESTTFNGMENLTHLSLAHNNISQPMLATALSQFSNESRLTALDLNSMGLNNITKDMVSSFSGLEVLILANNSIEYIEPSVMIHLSNLQTLELQENKLEALENTTYLGKVRRLDLKKNNFVIPISVSGLPNLELLDLSYNNIEVIPSHWITKSGTLRIVNLSHNKIHHISQHAFQKISLELLNLSHNQLTIMHNLGMLKIRTLLASNNHIRSLSNSAFDHLESTLEELDLSHNELAHLPQHTFLEFVALQRLNLADNDLGTAFQLGVHASLFHSLSKLQVMDLSANNITALPEDQFRSLRHLTTLYLHDNKIQDLNDLSLGHMPSLAKLDISNNLLGTVDTRVLMDLYYLETVDIGGNPFQCTCDIMHFLHWLNTTVVFVKGLRDTSKYMCSIPSRLRGRLLLSYRPSAAECLQPVHDIAWDLTIFGITVASVTGATIMAALIIYYGKICHRIKSLHYRWQVRYREVSGIEIADPKT